MVSIIIPSVLSKRLNILGLINRENQLEYGSPGFMVISKTYIA